MIAVQFEGVRKSFNDSEVIKGVDLSIEEGEFVVLVGPSGCGKSTLLRMLAGLEDLSGGRILVNGQDVTYDDPKDRDIAMVFQSYALYPHMTVAQNMGFSLKLRSWTNPAILDKVRDVSKTLGLEDLLDRYPRQLSGGQRQRVAMGRAIVRDPKVFLFDEPLSNLDAKLRVQMRTEIKNLHRKLGNTAIYVTHDQVEAMTMADKVVIMRDGVLEQAGASLDVYDNPVNTFVAQFIGSPAMNFLPGMVQTTLECRVVDFGGGLSVALPQGVNPRDGTAVSYGVRPEHLCVNSEGEGLLCTVLLVEPVGREILIYGTVGGTQICIAPGDRHRVKAGDQIHVAPKPGTVHIFDEESGKRL